ncbi:MAG: hypothetical protein HF973_11460 [Chloroflexi bacterium]|nr:hypothetical protein [Chloroflexota bacterium]
MNNNFVRALAFSPDGRLLAAGDGTGYGDLWLWEAATGQLRFTVPDVRVGLDNSFCFRPDGQFLACIDRDNALKLLHVPDETVCCVLAGSQSPIEVIRFSPDGSLLAALGRDGTLFIWQLAPDGSVLRQVHFQGRSANADFWNLAFSPDSQAVAFQLDTNNLGIFAVRHGELRCSMTELLYGVGSLAFSRDSAFLITGSADGRVRVWDAATGECRAALTGHESTVRSLAVNVADGRIASGGDDGAIRLWDIPAGECTLTLAPPRPYEGLDITGAVGLSPTRVETLKTLGAATDTSAGKPE